MHRRSGWSTGCEVDRFASERSSVLRNLGSTEGRPACGSSQVYLTNMAGQRHCRWMNELLVGSARVSTEQQDLTAQRNGLHALGVGDDRIYVDHGLTGTNRDRPGLRLALAACRAGDTLVVTKLDRLARSLPDARDILDELTKRNMKLSLGGSVHDPTDPVRPKPVEPERPFAQMAVPGSRPNTETSTPPEISADRSGCDHPPIGLTCRSKQDAPTLVGASSSGPPSLQAATSSYATTDREFHDAAICLDHAGSIGREAHRKRRCALARAC
jgi:hypothetical protein